MNHRCESLASGDFEPCPYCGEKPRWGCYKMVACRIAVLCISPNCKAVAFNEIGAQGVAVYAEDAVASWNVWASKTAAMHSGAEIRAGKRVPQAPT